MARLSIAFDRLRHEEKALAKSAEARGHDALMIDVKETLVDTKSTAESVGLAHAVLERCVSYYRGMCFTACAEFLGSRVTNSLAVAACCGNKLLMTLMLERAGVPTPRTRFAFSAEAASRIELPQVIKPLVGSWGRGVMLVKDRDAMDAVIETRAITDSPQDRMYYLQERVDRPPRDIRVLTVGERAVAAMYRRSDGFKTNVAAGAEPERCELTGEISELALRASRAVGGGILGVDMMEDADRGLTVHEVNNTVEFRGLSSTSDADIAGEMVDYALAEARR